MTTNQARAAQIINAAHIESARDLMFPNPSALTQALADAGLLAPDLPEPTKILDDGSPMWNVNHSSIGVDDGLVYIDGGLFAPEDAGEAARAILAATVHATQEKK